MRDLVLAVSPGSSTTKVGLFRRTQPLARHVEAHAHGGGVRSASEQAQSRTRIVRAFLERAGVETGVLAAVVGRAGLLRPIPGGTYLVDEALLRDAERGSHGEHPANLAAAIARTIADEQGCPAYVVEPLSADELDVVARVTGIPGVVRHGRCDLLPMRVAARQHARAVQRPMAELRLVVAHVGSDACAVCAFREGRAIDVVNRCDECPLSSTGSGAVPPQAVVSMCFAPGATEEGVRRAIEQAGLLSHAGTREVEEVARRAERGDGRAVVLLDAMAYQVAKCVGELAVALGGEVEAVLLTGKGAQVTAILNGICRRVEWIAPVFVYPGEDDLAALAEGAWRVLSGEEPPRSYG